MGMLGAWRTRLVVAVLAMAATCIVPTARVGAAVRGDGGGHEHFGGRPLEAPHGFHDAPGHFGAPAPGHFHAIAPDRWRSGQWHHELHAGRFGWWWVVDDGWYFYPNAAYPYPQYWYYCGSAGAYYPYVSACPEGWTPVVPEQAPPAS